MGENTSVELCSDCEQDLEHCHGIAIVHVDGTTTCTDDFTCWLAGDLHLLVALCGDSVCCEF